MRMCLKKAEMVGFLRIPRGEKKGKEMFQKEDCREGGEEKRPFEKRKGEGGGSYR